MRTVNLDQAESWSFAKVPSPSLSPLSADSKNTPSTHDLETSRTCTQIPSQIHQKLLAACLTPDPFLKRNEEVGSSSLNTGIWHSWSAGKLARAMGGRGRLDLSLCVRARYDAERGGTGGSQFWWFRYFRNRLSWVFPSYPSLVNSQVLHSQRYEDPRSR